MKLNLAQAEAYCHSDEGFCPTCDEFTNGGVEPDAQEYECISCGENTVVGAEFAIAVLGLIEITED